jgi:hypothetical protein
METGRRTNQVSLEIQGEFASVGLDPQMMFEYTIAALLPGAWKKEATSDS